MSIFGNRGRMGSSFEEMETGFIQPTSECLEGILTESAHESYQIRAGLYVSDIIMEEAVFEGAASPEVLMEGFGKDLWTKIKNMFMKMWNKIKSWFEKVKRFFSLLFKSGKEFIDKFENEIRAKVAKGFKYKGYKYSLAKGHTETESYLEKSIGKALEYTNGITKVDEIVNTGKQYDALNAMDKSKMDASKDYKTSDTKDEVLKSITGEDSLDEFSKKLAKDFRSGEDSTEEYENFSGNSKEEMINEIKNADKNIALINASEKAINTQMERTIKAIESAAGRFKGEDAGKIAPHVTHSTEMIRYVVGISTTAMRVELDATKEAVKDFETILKAFLRFKPAKEGFDGGFGDNSGATSILEAAMKLV